jgi:hypothetical protein
LTVELSAMLLAVGPPPMAGIPVVLFYSYSDS